ncbi:aminoglycoside phosphotransferase family protein [Micromonospora endophytica]|uniref:Acetyltransferase n=1 Tax=Micromonospora endophytica TaxID=515350 RepID=A0A2W2DIM1_9ACTN|nr:aminoglycoside phosphotransferase family protein [Micromonospora endophytica]PZF97036.1 acetyltransferase [Micromonospora endophytica]RIW40502.1 aminoglycoside phosphotransferase family protein [Micromonospora endophytica]BCJ58931.1 aminoglycoside phosphotransferase [Micromonospora endophytica]
MASTIEDETGLDGRAGITAELVERLIAAQFPQWSGLPVRPVPVDGHDNRTYRLGTELTVRLPTAAGYVPAVAKENEWVPRVAPQLPVAVPPILGLGVPGEGYPFPWSVRDWLPGETADRWRIDDLPEFAVAVAGFLRALQACDPGGGPLAGEHSFYRGAPPDHYDEQTRQLLATLGGHLDVARARTVWEAALAARWRGEPVWFHGDIAVGNLLVDAGKLSAVIDFGTCGVGDPACDLVIAWTMFSGESRLAFRQAVGQDDGTWARARGWALWKAMLMVRQHLDGAPELAVPHKRVVSEVLDDHDRFG